MKVSSGLRREFPLNSDLSSDGFHQHFSAHVMRQVASIHMLWTDIQSAHCKDNV